jgi:hypothetical protein
VGLGRGVPVGGAKVGLGWVALVDGKGVSLGTGLGDDVRVAPPIVGDGKRAWVGDEVGADSWLQAVRKIKPDNSKPDNRQSVLGFIRPPLQLMPDRPQESLAPGDFVFALPNAPRQPLAGYPMKPCPLTYGLTRAANVMNHSLHERGMGEVALRQARGHALFAFAFRQLPSSARRSSQIISSAMI